ncbi:MAG: alpha/beta hydrolase-fold protein [Planctomycetota bacterium]
MLFRRLLTAPPLLLALLLAPLLASLRAQDVFPETATVKLFEHRSELLSTFWGRDMSVRAGVVLPNDLRDDEKLSVCYSIHGFGGSHRGAIRRGPELVAGMTNGTTPRMLYVFLDAQFSLGHHEFADSVNNGPWGKALTTEFVPALEQHFHAFGAPTGRFLTGHSSGGWSSLWLQVAYPDFFGGTWSTAPDSVDFRDFTGIDVYSYANAFTDPEGKPIQLVRRNGEFVRSIEQFVTSELEQKDYGGQFMSFNAVFSPRGEDGRPMPLFDAKTGAIDRFVANCWRKYDIGLILRDNWATLGPKLKGKLRVYVGTQDTFRLEGACHLLHDDLARLGSDAEIVFAEGRDHGALLRAHAELWPHGLMARIYGEMRAKFDASLGKAGTAK